MFTRAGGQDERFIYPAGGLHHHIQKPLYVRVGHWVHFGDGKLKPAGDRRAHLAGIQPFVVDGSSAETFRLKAAILPIQGRSGPAGSAGARPRHCGLLEQGVGTPLFRLVRQPGCRQIRSTHHRQSLRERSD